MVSTPPKSQARRTLRRDRGLFVILGRSVIVRQLNSPDRDNVPKVFGFAPFLAKEKDPRTSPSQRGNAKVRPLSPALALLLPLPSAIFQLHFIYHNLLTLIYRYTAARHICMRHRNLHWPSLNVTVLLNDRSTGRGLSLERGPRDGNSWNFHASRDSWSRRTAERYTAAIRLSKNSAFCNGNRFPPTDNPDRINTRH